MRIALLLCFLTLPCTSVRAQGPISGFPTPKGEIAIALGYSSEKYGTYLLPEDMLEAREVETIGYSLFVEAGLSANTALVATLPYLRTNDREGSLQDAALWLKYLNSDKRGKHGSRRVFTAVGLSVPVGNYETDGIAALGQRATVFQGRLAWQYQHDSGWFLHAQTGFDFQFVPEAQSSWPLLLRTGYGGQWFYLEGWLEYVTAIESGTGVQTATAGTGSSWRRLGGTFYVPVTRWFGISVGGAAVLGGAYIGQSGRWNTGVVFKLGTKQ